MGKGIEINDLKEAWETEQLKVVFDGCSHEPVREQESGCLVGYEGYAMEG